MPNPRSLEAWAKNLVVDQIHEQTKCECQFLGDTLTKMCPHHEFQMIAISNALRAYAAQVRKEEQQAHEGLRWCLDQVADLLASSECCHGHSDPKATPPMMFPEWIVCVMKKRVEAERAKKCEVCGCDHRAV